MTDPPHIIVYHDVPLPTSLAAPIQILHTCRALAARGTPTTVRLRSIDGSVENALRYYGLEPHPLLRLESYSATRLRWQGRLGIRGPPVSRAGQARPLGSDGTEGARTVAIARGESALALLPWLARFRQGPGQRFVYEAHRLCHTRVAQLGGPGARHAGRVRRAEAATLDIADGVVCLNDGVHAALAAAFDSRAPVLELPSGTNVPADDMLPADTDRDIDILVAGKLEAHKGTAVLVRALTRLPGRDAWIVGGLPPQVERIRSLARELGVADRLTLTGHLPAADVPALLRRARVGVCPLPAGDDVAEHFTSPLKILEMMAWGVPIVASDLPSTRRMLEHDRTALLVEPGSPDALAAGIERLLRDRALATRLTRAARLEVRQYAWQRRADRLLDFVTSLP